jgi:hypothetical protein
MHRTVMLSVVCGVTLAALAAGCKQNRSPTAPQVSGPSLGTPGATLTYTFSSTDPENEGIAYMVGWGDTCAVGWSSSHASGKLITVTHSYPDSGVYHVKVKARDAQQAESEWSDSIVVSIVLGPGSLPQSFLLSAATDSTVELFWTAPTQATPNCYNLYFKDVAETSLTFVGTTSSTMTFHDPQGATGLYAVSAVYDGGECFCAETLSTVPVHTSEMTLFEINVDSSRCGYGWNRFTGRAGVFPMTQSIFVDSVDFYLSDLWVGHSGTWYAVVSPDKASQIDTGAAGIVPNAAWRQSGFTNPLHDAQRPLPAYQPPPYATYFIYTVVEQAPCYIGLYTIGEIDKHYALIQVNGMDILAGTAQVEAWYQLVTGLRLTKH